MPRMRGRARLDASSYGGRSEGVFCTLTYPHLILPYSGYYGHLASRYGGHWSPPIPWWCNKKHSHVPEPPIYVKMIGLMVLTTSTVTCCENPIVQEIDRHPTKHRPTIGCLTPIFAQKALQNSFFDVHFSTGSSSNYVLWRALLHR